MLLISDEQIATAVSVKDCVEVAQVRVEDLVDDRIVRRLDSSGFIAKAYDYGVGR
jgi:hypothetical protein